MDLPRQDLVHWPPIIRPRLCNLGPGLKMRAVNNYWFASSRQASDVGAGVMAVTKANLFQPIFSQLYENLGNRFSSPSIAANTTCSKYLRYARAANGFGALVRSQELIIPPSHLSVEILFNQLVRHLQVLH